MILILIQALINKYANIAKISKNLFEILICLGGLITTSIFINSTNPARFIYSGWGDDVLLQNVVVIFYYAYNILRKLFEFYYKKERNEDGLLGFLFVILIANNFILRLIFIMAINIISKIEIISEFRNKNKYRKILEIEIIFYVFAILFLYNGINNYFLSFLFLIIWSIMLIKEIGLFIYFKNKIILIEVWAIALFFMNMVQAKDINLFASIFLISSLIIYESLEIIKIKEIDFALNIITIILKKIKRVELKISILVQKSLIRYEPTSKTVSSDIGVIEYRHQGNLGSLKLREQVFFVVIASFLVYIISEVVRNSWN